jgi:hypothetical protein
VKSRLRILGAVLALYTLLASVLGRPDIICVESSGRVSYGCNDLVPDELAARLGVSPSAGLSSQDCGFCHDFVVGQATTHSIHALAAPIRAIDYHLLALVRHNSIASDLLLAVSIIDSSGNPPLKC